MTGAFTGGRVGVSYFLRQTLFNSLMKFSYYPFYLILVFLIPLVSGCGSSKKSGDESSDLEDVKGTLHELHNSSMSVMGELEKVELQLIVEIQNEESPIYGEAEALLDSIQGQNDRMMEWMRAYQPNADSTRTDQDRILKLQSQGAVLRDIMEDMERTKENAGTLLAGRGE